MIKILIVEDDLLIADLIYKSLCSANYSCTVANDGLTAADFLENNNYDLVLLDIMLPKFDGYQLLEYIKPLKIPVIFLSAKATVEDRVKGLKCGADDYLVKPFEVIELLARVESVLRRYNKIDTNIEIDDLVINTESYQVKKNGLPVMLTKKEFDLLLLLVQNKNVALFRDTIFERVWEQDEMGDSRTVDLHIQRLRKKLGWEKYIKAVYKVGYRLEIPE